jgi:hypothetical protein
MGQQTGTAHCTDSRMSQAPTALSAQHYTSITTVRHCGLVLPTLRNPVDMWPVGWLGALTQSL